MFQFFSFLPGFLDLSKPFSLIACQLQTLTEHDMSFVVTIYAKNLLRFQSAL